MISIIKSGVLDSIQDAGRFGHAAMGIPTNGVMDGYAMRVANALTGNQPGEAVIEMHFPAARIRFDSPAWIALSGADFDAAIGDTSIPVNKLVRVPAGSVLAFRKRLSGWRCYLAVRGGFQLEPWLGSVSTNIPAKMGGLNGKRLHSNDQLAFRENRAPEAETIKIYPWRADTNSVYMDAHYLYFIKGPEWDWLDEASRYKFVQESFRISPNSDRMAIRLQGDTIACATQDSLVSSAVAMGTMQLLPSGEVLVLMADHQTTGGYPRIGTVITAHLPRLAQAAPGDYLHMLQVDAQTAEDLLFSQQEELEILKWGSEFRIISSEI